MPNSYFLIAAASVNDFKEKLKNHMEEWFSSLKTHLKNSKDPHNSDLLKVKEKLEHLEVSTWLLSKAIAFEIKKKFLFSEIVFEIP